MFDEEEEKSKYIIEIERTVDIPEVDYKEKTPSWTEDEEEEEIKNNENEEEKNQIENNQVQNIQINNKKEIVPKYLNLNNKNDIKYLFDSYQKLFINKDYFNKMPSIFFEHLLKLNQRLNRDLSQNLVYIDNDFILNDILHLFSHFLEEDINNENIFIEKFEKYSPIDMPKELMINILTQFQIMRKKNMFIRNIEKIFGKYNINTIITQKIVFLFREFNKIRDEIIDQFMKVLYYQKGKIENKKIDNILFITSKSKFHFLNNLINSSNEYIQYLLFKKYKFTIIRFLIFYQENINPIEEYFSFLSKYIISAKENIKEEKKITNCLLDKYIIDMMYKRSNYENELYSEIFIYIMEVYVKFIYEFIINGNLLDVYNEFFIDHIFTKKDYKKIIFNYNEKFKIINWIECFKIKSFPLNNKEVACVPLPFMLNNIHFKILETGKITFLIKNLNVINYSDEFNKELFFNDNNNIDVINEYFNKKQIKKDDSFNELNLLNENLKIRKLEILENGKELKDLKFAKEEKIEEEKKEELINFLQDTNNINQLINDNEIDIDMEDLSKIKNNQIIQNKNSLNEINPFSKDNTNKDVNNIYNTINEISKSKNKDSFRIYNINIIINHLFLNKINEMNKIMNSKFLNVLFDRLNVKLKFDLVFFIYLFKAGFSMNKFIIELNNFIFNKVKSENTLTMENNFFLKSLINELASTLGSDLYQFKNEIIENIHISFNDVKSFIHHSNEDLINLIYKAPLPSSILFDDNIMRNYNSVFNFIVKLKRSFILVRDISLDKKLKKIFFDFPNQKIFTKYLISYRLFIMDFATSLEFYVFHFVIDKFINKFEITLSNINSIDQAINSHQRFINDIYNFLGLNDQKYMNKIYKILNMIVDYPIFIDKFILSDKNNGNELNKLFIEISNEIEDFKRKTEEINNILESLKEKVSFK